MQSAEGWGEWILPAGTFRGEGSGKALRNARVLTALFYLVLACLFASTLVALCFSGRVEVMRTGYKVDRVETPSVVVCPFHTNHTIKQPTDGKAPFAITKFGTNGKEPANATIRTCKFDRVCMCAEMYGSVFQDYLGYKVKNIGSTGEKSERAMMFRERMEVVTHLMDPSEDKTLKIGFYDSTDETPMWFYMKQGSYVLGSLELQSWSVSDFTFRALWATIRGKLMAMVDKRHIFRYTSQEVARSSDAGRSEESKISYQMKNFFVDETVSAESAFSIHTLGFLLLLVAGRSAVINIFITTMFPKYEDAKAKGRRERLELSPIAETISTFFPCCCCCPTPPDEAVEEHAPLKEP